MLRLIDIRAAETGTVSADDHLPLKLEFESAVGGTGTLIVTNGDGTTLVDIGVDLSSGRIVRASLVGATPEVDQLNPSIQALPTEAGLPLFDVGIFPSEQYTPRVDWHTQIRVQRDDDLIYVRMTNDAPAQKLTAGKAKILFAGDRLVGFEGRTARP